MLFRWNVAHFFRFDFELKVGVIAYVLEIINDLVFENISSADVKVV